MQDDLIALAERCEAAEGPDRELDATIRCAVFAPKDAFVKLSPFNGEWCIYEIGYGGKERGWEGRGVSPLQRTGAFTASLDAAMTLVPEGWRMWSADFSIAGRFVWMLSGPKQQWIVHEDGSKEGGDDWYQSGVGKTAALGLVAAAIRIRATQARPAEQRG